MDRVFPVHTGMNRISMAMHSFINSVPRTHGDEPTYQRIERGETACSPYTRG